MLRKIFETTLNINRRAILGTFILCSPLTFAKSATNPINVQAALIKNFTHLINWPTSHQWNSDNHFNLCVYDSSSVLKQFETLFFDKVIKGKKARIIHVESTDLEGCDLTYLANTSAESVQHLIESAQHKGVLIIGSNIGYGELGVHINFYEQGESIAFELNKHTLDEAGFTVSAQLFRYAKLVQ